MSAENIRWGYKNADGHRLHVSTVGAGRDHVELAIAGVGDFDWRSVNIRAADAPGIALAILKAAGIQRHGGTHLVVGDRRDMWAVRYLTEHVEAQAEDAAEAELTRRKDELAVKLMQERGFSTSVASYKLVAPVAQAAIDMIIELQDAATK
ncbi:hypothetical protein [Arthrobacter cryoconiti]|uniref:Uncharacterized protein n=1 Tax=Arthrobacter cryoconiti TaxID=748907 RepID=A0ABV8QWM5_9MICC|nr:hypothetical protein [Arthrobacter cryoconiti]MCC9068820.1 hypothetical protein [Arthrobacter cryoconiti]